MGSKNTRFTRRRFSVLAGAGVVGLSGCLSGDDDDEPEDDDESSDDGEPGDDEDSGEDGEVDVDNQPDDATATFATPEDGGAVTSPVEIEANVDGIELAEAGEAVEGEGHLHVLVDHEGFEDGESIPGPSDEAEANGIYHWGDGQSDGEIELEPGEYDLILQIADGPHRAFGEPDEITVTVDEE